jgi:hypothetical protein
VLATGSVGSFSGNVTYGGNPTTIRASLSGIVNLVLISGNLAGIQFSDLIIVAYGVIKVVSSNTIAGSPPTRAYTMSGANLQVGLSVGSPYVIYTVSVAAF